MRLLIVVEIGLRVVGLEAATERTRVQRGGWVGALHVHSTALHIGEECGTRPAPEHLLPIVEVVRGREVVGGEMRMA